MAAGKIPDWVTAERFEDVLKSNVDGYSKVRNFKAEMGSAAGDNYATNMLRVNIEVELQGELGSGLAGSTVDIKFLPSRWHHQRVVIHGQVATSKGNQQGNDEAQHTFSATM